MHREHGMLVSMINVTRDRIDSLADALIAVHSSLVIGIAGERKQRHVTCMLGNESVLKSVLYRTVASTSSVHVSTATNVF
jgi:hypothetical protein